MLTKLISRKALRIQPCIPWSAKDLIPSRGRSTIDQERVSFYRGLSPVWWDRGGSLAILHAMNDLYITMVRDGLIDIGTIRKELVGTPKPLQDLTILDAGCGGGIFAELMAKLGANVTGIDPVAELIEQGRQRAKLDSSLSNLKYHVGTIEEHATNNSGKYDVVTAGQVLSHVADHDLFLEVCVECLKPGGSIFITTVNKTMAAWLAGMVILERLTNMVPRGAHDWDKLITPSQTQKILEKYKCKARFVRGTGYNPFTNKWFWVPHTSVYYAIHAIKG